MLVPAGAACHPPQHLVAHATATDLQKPPTLANPPDSETILLAAIAQFGRHRLPGFAKSQTATTLPARRFEATSVIDSARRANAAERRRRQPVNGKVMFTGYSQGGHASMAAHRAAERDHATEFNVVAAPTWPALQPVGFAQLTDAIVGTSISCPSWSSAEDLWLGDSVKTVFKAPYSTYSKPAAQSHAELHHAGDQASCRGPA